jgi:hypothetical protein
LPDELAVLDKNNTVQPESHTKEGRAHNEKEIKEMAVGAGIMRSSTHRYIKVNKARVYSLNEFHSSSPVS